jgi:Ca-activated chloride channel family protein
MPKAGRRSRGRDDGAAYSMPAAAPIAAEMAVDRAAVSDLPARAADEARALRAAASAPEYERRELLADLGTRLAALVTGTAWGSDPAVRDLVAALADDRPLSLGADEFTALWERTLRVLDDLAGGSAQGGAAGSAQGAPARRAFWKR